MSKNDSILYYIHDPMCSWCWAFRPVWKQLEQHLTSLLHIEYVLGGLAADSDVLMSVTMQHNIQRHWHAIEQRVAGTQFNFDFWTQCQPRRSTYPACRAVLAARQQGEPFEKAMIFAIQQAYYLHADNPSDDSVLMALALQIGLDVALFRVALHASETQDQLLKEVAQAQQIWNMSGAGGFPSLVLYQHGRWHEMLVDYHDVEVMLARIRAR